MAMKAAVKVTVALLLLLQIATAAAVMTAAVGLCAGVKIYMAGKEETLTTTKITHQSTFNWAWCHPFRRLFVGQKKSESGWYGRGLYCCVHSSD